MSTSHQPPCPPVLILAFNRPAETAQLVESLAAVEPPVVYAAVDGPRDAVPSDRERCAEVQAILSSMPWNPTLHTLFRRENLGCGPAVAGGIDWFFENETEGIILEDDIRPHPSMFPYMAQLLERYRDDERVMHISANNYAGVRPATDYFFSRYISIWGWATWRRAWRHFDLDISDWRRAPSVLDQPGLAPPTRRYLAFAFGRAVVGLGNWDYQWKYAVLRHGLAINPSVNLAVTTGFGEDATNLRQAAKVPSLEEMPLELNHPSAVAADTAMDEQFYAEQIGRAGAARQIALSVLRSPRLYDRVGRIARAVSPRLLRS